MQLTSHGLGVDIERERDLDKGVASPITTGGLADIVLAHLAAVHSSPNAACFEVHGDGPTVDAEFTGEIGQCPPCLVFAYELVDLGFVQSTQDWLPAGV